MNKRVLDVQHIGEDQSGYSVDIITYRLYTHQYKKLVVMNVWEGENIILTKEIFLDKKVKKYTPSQIDFSKEGEKNVF